jgi:hypothetical protein
VDSVLQSNYPYVFNIPLYQASKNGKGSYYDLVGDWDSL